MEDETDEHETEVLMDRGLGFYVKCWTCGWQSERHFTPGGAETQAQEHRQAMSEGRPGPPGL